MPSFKQIKFTGAMKRAAETSPTVRAVRSSSTRSKYTPHAGAKEQARMARLQPA